MRLLLRAIAATLCVAASILASAVPAEAHTLRYGDDASNWVSAVNDVQPSGVVHASVGDGGLRLTVRLGSARSVVVDGSQGEPFLLLQPGGAWLNASNVAPPQWKRVAHTASWSWHDTRTHWPGYSLPPPVLAHPERRQHVLDWRIALRADGAPGAIIGGLDWVPGPSGGAGAAIATGAFALVLALGLWRRRTAVIGASLIALVVADVAHSVGMIDGRTGDLGNRLAALPGHGGLPLALWLLAIGTVVLLVRRREFGLYAAAMLAVLFCFTEALPSLGVLWHSQAVNAIPMSANRALVGALTGASVATAVAAVIVIVRTARSPIDGGHT
jgi:hypothetical protein